MLMTNKIDPMKLNANWQYRSEDLGEEEWKSFNEDENCILIELNYQIY